MKAIRPSTKRELVCCSTVLALLWSAACHAATPTVLASGLNAPFNIIVDDSSVYWTEEPSAGVAGFPRHIGSISKTSNGGAPINYNYAVDPVYKATDDLVENNGFLYYTSGYSDGTYAYSALYKVPKTGGSATVISPLKNPFWSNYGPAAFAIDPIGGGVYYSTANQAPNDRDDAFDTVVSLSTLGGSESILTYSSYGWGAGGNYTLNGATWYYGLAALAYDKSKNNSFSYCSTKGFGSASTDSLNLYWSDGSAIWSMPLRGGEATALVSSSSHIYSIATPTTGAAAGSIFWVEASGGSATLKRRDVSGQITTLLAPSPNLSFFHNCFAVSDDKVYCGYTGGLVQVSINGGAVTVLVDYAAGLGPIGVATDDTYIYWSLADQILRTAKPGGTPVATSATLGNISTRLQVGTGSNVLFAGFIIQGSASKTVLIRSAGPSLTSFGVPGALGNPRLELHDANNTIGTNDNWQTTQLGGVITSNQVAAIQNSGAPPTDPAEPAIIATLPAGQYTAIVQGVSGTQGIATVEVYDLSPNNGAILANISTRGFIQTGDNVMIGGFIVVGQTSRVLIVAAGPSLIPFGINNALTNPRLELHDMNGTLAANDDWQTTQLGAIITSDQSAAIQNSGLAPSNPAESAIIATLAPGNYTAIAQGVNGGTGVGLVEVFALP